MMITCGRQLQTFSKDAPSSRQRHKLPNIIIWMRPKVERLHIRAVLFKQNSVQRFPSIHPRGWKWMKVNESCEAFSASSAPQLSWQSKNVTVTSVLNDVIWHFNNTLIILSIHKAILNKETGSEPIMWVQNGCPTNLKCFLVFERYCHFKLGFKKNQTPWNSLLNIEALAHQPIKSIYHPHTADSIF